MRAIVVSAVFIAAVSQAGCADVAGSQQSAADAIGDSYMAVSAPTRTDQHSQAGVTPSPPAPRPLAGSRERVPAPSSVGALIAGTGDERHDLELTRLVVHGSPSAGMVAVVVDHTFRNERDEQLEATFRFALPPGGIVTGLDLEIDGRMVPGEIVEKRKAERIYREIVDEMRDPALLKWQGGELELRVFPVMPRATKRVRLRYLAPLQLVDGMWRWRIAIGRPTSGGPIGEVRVELEGGGSWFDRDVERGQSFDLAVAKAEPSRVQAFEQPAPDGGAIIAVQLPVHELLQDAQQLENMPPDTSGHTKDSDNDSALGAAQPRHVIAVVDRSRSALESVEMQQQALAALVQHVPVGTSLQLIAFDISCREHPEVFRINEAPNTRSSVVASWSQWLSQDPPDGASDLGRALQCAAQAINRPGKNAIVLLTDGSHTWGESDYASRIERARQLPNDVRINIVAIGTSLDLDHISALATAGDGEVVVPVSRGTLDKDIARMIERQDLPRCRGVRVDAGSAAVRIEGGAVAFEEMPVVALVHVGRGERMPDEITLHGECGRDVRSVDVHLPTFGAAEGLVQRFGAASVAQMQARGAPRDAIVVASQRFGVMSKHTALLVLESEEAYRRHKIDRRNRNRQQLPATVTGGDLESVDNGPTVSPSQVQPGDPEVWIPAPRDARSVHIVLPWNERVAARWVEASDQHAAGWVARFLIDLAAPEGTYPIAVTVVLQDGREQRFQLHIRVDKTPPVVRVSATPHRRTAGTYVLRARQLNGKDARGVELRMPDGQLIPLTALARGRFVGRWAPAAPFEWPLTVESHAIDRALNQVTATLELPRAGVGVVARRRVGVSALSALGTTATTRRQHGGLSAASFAAPEVGTDVTGLAVGRDGLLVGTLQDGVWQRETTGSLRRYEACGRPLGDHRINDLRARAGTIWVATSHGLYARPLDCGTARPVALDLRRAHGLPSDMLHSVLPIADGAIAGTAEGIAFVRVRKGQARIKPLGRKQGLPARAVWDLAKASDDRLWVASSWGAYAYRNGDVQRFSVATGHLRDDWVTALASVGEAVWVGTYKGGVTRIERHGGQWQAVHLGGRHVNLHGLAVSGSQLLVATMQGLHRASLKGGLAPAVPVGRDRNATFVLRRGDQLFVGTRSSVRTWPWAAPSATSRP